MAGLGLYQSYNVPIIIKMHHIEVFEAGTSPAAAKMHGECLMNVLEVPSWYLLNLYQGGGFEICTRSTRKM